MQIVHGFLNGTSRNTDAGGKNIYDVVSCIYFFGGGRHSDGSAFHTLSLDTPNNFWRGIFRTVNRGQAMLLAKLRPMRSEET